LTNRTLRRRAMAALDAALAAPDGPERRRVLDEALRLWRAARDDDGAPAPRRKRSAERSAPAKD